MPGTNAGTGQPLHFRCSKCRARGASWPFGLKTRVELSGQERPIDDGNSRGRSTSTLRQYECLDCGHIGWSRHVDLEWLSHSLHLEPGGE